MEPPVASPPTHTLPLALFDLRFPASWVPAGPRALQLPTHRGQGGRAWGKPGGAGGPSLSAEKGLQEQGRTPDLKLPGLLQRPAPGKPSETSPDC